MGREFGDNRLLLRSGTSRRGCAGQFEGAVFKRLCGTFVHRPQAFAAHLGIAFPTARLPGELAR